MKLRQLHLKTRITALVLIFVLMTMWTLTLVMTNHIEKDVTYLLKSQQFAAATDIAKSIDEELKFRIKMLEATASRITPQMVAHPDALREYLQNDPDLYIPFGVGIVIISNEGKGIADYPVLQGQVGGSFLEREYFRNVIGTNKPAIGKPRVGRFSKVPEVGFAVPIYDGAGHRIAVLAAFSELSDKDLLGPVNASVHSDFQDRILVVSARDRLIVTGSDPSRALTPLPAPGTSPLLDRFLSGYEGSGTMTTTRGIELFASARQIPTAGWFVRVGVPVEQVFAQWRHIRTMAYSIAAGMTLLISTLIWFTVRQALRPLDEASEKIHRMTTGKETVQPLPVEQDDEIGQLIESFNTHIEWRQASEAKLKSSEQFYKSITDNGQALIWLSGLDKGCIYFNKPWLDFTGRRLEQELGNGWAEGVHPEDFERCLAIYVTAFDRHEKFDMVYRLRRHDGEYRWILDEGTPRFDDQGTFLGFVGHCLDITERKNAEEALSAQQAYLKTIIETEPECVKVVSPTGQLTEMNSAGLRMLEVDSLEEAKQFGLLEFVDPDFRQAFVKLHQKVCAGESGVLEFLIKGKKGTVRWLETHATPLRDAEGTVIAMLGVTRDVSERKLLQKELEEQARVDFLTGLHNRGFFMEQAETELARTTRYESKLSVFMLDIDNFKRINDSYGHKSGDAVLKKLAEVFRHTLREVDIIGRVGGEEFAVMLPETDKTEAAEVAERLRVALAAVKVPLENGLPLSFTVSIGVASLASPGDNLDVLLNLADKALYAAKNAGRNRVSVAAA